MLILPQMGRALRDAIGGDGSITPTRLTSMSSGSSIATYNFTPTLSGQANKLIALLVWTVANNSLNVLPTGVTFGGATATMREGQFVQTSLGTVSIWSVELGASPTNAAVVTLANSGAGCQITPYVMDGADSIVPTDGFVTDTAGATSLNGSLTTPAGGLTLVGSISASGTSRVSWSGSLIEAADNTFATVKSISDAYRTGGASGETITATFTESLKHQMVAAAWAPAASGGISELGTALTPEYSSNTTGQTTSLASFGLQEGDVIGIAIVCDNLSFNDLSTTNTGIVDVYTRGSSPGPGRQFSYIICGATPPTNVTVDTNAGGFPAAAIIRAFRGMDTASILDGTVPALSTASSGAVNPPSQTTASAGSWRMIVGFVDDTQTLGYTAPSGFTDLVEATTPSVGASSSAVAVWAIQKDAAAGAVDPAAFGGVTPSTAWTAGHASFKAA